MRLLTAALAALLVGPTASAQETIDLGVIRDDDITVVQKLLYPKEGRAEIGVHAGVMPFDAYVTNAVAQLSYNQHLSERLSISVMGGGGYGFKTAVYKKLESPAYGVAPYAYRYLGGALGGIEWAPIYAKMNVNGSRVIHFDTYLAARAGVTLESSLIAGGGTALSPTLSPGLGSRLFLSKSTALRAEFRDDLMLQKRSLTNETAFKQNANVTLGLTFLTGGGE
jgi:outer membrane beta-barrel protein